MGGESSGQKLEEQSAQQSQATTQQELALAQQRYQYADSLNAPLVNFAQSIIGGNSTTTQQALAPVLSQITQSNTQAKGNILDSTAPGAARDLGLENLNLQQGAQTASATNSNFLNAFQTLSGIAGQQFGVAGNQLGAGISSQGQTISAASNLAQTQEQQKASTLGFLGQLAGSAGSIASAGITKCWIAEAIYGFDDERTHLVRAWINGPFEERIFGRIVGAAYGAIGRQVAWFVRRSAILRACFKPLFDMALVRARKES